MSSNLRLPKICSYCGKDFIAKKSITLCCSEVCTKRFYKKRKREELVQVNLEKFQDKKTEQVNTLGNKEFLSISETCTLLGIGRTNLYTQIKSGMLPVIKLGSRTIISRKVLESTLQNR
ncbi:MAG: helix-turn-helix domain-containing protein [Bacteroidia bacterium]